ncbi:Zinc finger, C3HC4 type (RING finger) [Musa troglodytarum]|uniref:E3 ubiquitin-protein ligase RMA n=1 Tax=Musa troglodytarum TaxID=320322 RepID=A0A9E7EPN1_9LILI|nr:Zinc finger, C3HC4 type (RING finger) [Musa troglodytarum]
MNFGFDCSICLEFAADPVVTLCGHLYCWPCIFKWMQAESISNQQCPVCRAVLSQDTLIPLYGCGRHSTKGDSAVPHRPTLHRHRDGATITSAREHGSPRMNEAQQPQFHHQHHYPSYAAQMSPWFCSTTGSVLGGLAISILPWVFRNHDASIYYSNLHHLTFDVSSPRLRRQQMQVESSLHQIWLFLFFCAILCLLLF